MRLLVDAAPQDFVEWLFHGARFLDWHAPEFVGKECIADKLLLIEYEGKQYLLHIEFQKAADDTMAERIWQYNAQATWKYGKPVYSVVIYLTKIDVEKLARSPFVQRLHHGEVVHRFRFQVVTLWNIATEDLFRSGLKGLLP